MAAVRDGRLLDYAIHRPGAPDLVGAVLRGRVTGKVSALAGAFVALGGALVGFLPDSAGAASVGEGTVLAVRVTRAAQGGKGPRLAAAGDDPGDGALGVIASGPDALHRLAALHAGAPIVEREFGEALEAQVAALAEPRIALPGGGVMTIEPTAALVAIDLDSGGGSGVRAGKVAAHMAANAGFIGELAREIRVRNLGGPIVVDFAGLSPRRRAALGPALAEALASDPVRPRFLGFSALGLAEILRPRIHPPLHELLGTAHAAGLAALRALAREVDADPARPHTVHAAADVADALFADAVAQAELARSTGRRLSLCVDRALAARAWRLERT